MASSASTEKGQRANNETISVYNEKCCVDPLEQCSLTGGNESSLAMSLFLILAAESRSLPLIHSVAREEEAMAEPQPNVLNLASTILPLSST